MKPFINIIILFLLILTSTFVSAAPFWEPPELESFDTLLKLASEPPIEHFASEEIYLKDHVAFCTGNLPAAVANNRGADLMIAGRYEEASKIFEDALTKAPLFYPFQYNIGICYNSMRDYPRSELHLKKALQIIPEYDATYLQLGLLSASQRDDITAIKYFQEALHHNNKELDVFILIGNVYYNRNQIEMAERYYNGALTINPRYINGKLGKAKIFYYRREFFKALLILRNIDLTADYDKSFHYYYAECAYKNQDYQTAYDQYTKLLEFRGDRFFFTNSIARVKHKQELAEKFIK